MLNVSTELLLKILPLQVPRSLADWQIQVPHRQAVDVAVGSEVVAADHRVQLQTPPTRQILLPPLTPPDIRLQHPRLQVQGMGRQQWPWHRPPLYPHRNAFGIALGRPVGPVELKQFLTRQYIFL